MTDANGRTTIDGTATGFEDGLAQGASLLDRDPAAALDQAEKLVRVRRDPRAFELAAAAFRRLGKPAEAEQAELGGIKASFAMKALDDAAVADFEGRSLESRTMVAAFLEQNPDNLLALTMAAEADMNSWELASAEARLRKVLDRAPTYLRGIMLLARCLVQQARLQEAIALVDEVVARKPDNITALQYLAQLCGEANQFEKAAATYGRIVELQPSQVDMWILYAQHLRMMGSDQESQAAFRRALAMEPTSGAAWWGLAYYYASAITAEDIEAMERALQSVGESPQDGGPLHVALGVMAERRGEHAEAFRHISTGKELRAREHPHDPDVQSAHVDELIGAFTAERYAEVAGAGFPDNSPIFIVGMPRSGTTLLERILSRHSEIEAGGELPIIQRMAAAGAGSSGVHIATATAEDLKQLGEQYIARSKDYRTEHKPRFIDKMNSNWFRVALIRMMLPNARIIDLRRNALDCCWSNFKMMFAEGTVAANDQRGIARFYRDYVRMIEAVDEAAPGGILKVRYEELVDDIEGQTRRIFDFLGLDYEPECIDFHLSTAAVATPSSEQVRQPLNRKSIGSAEPYREWLAPMIEELGELASAR